jgi:WD40 repeat protein
VRSIIKLSNGYYACGSADCLIRIFSKKGIVKTTFDSDNHDDVVRDLIELPDEKLCSAGYDGQLKIWSLSGKCKKTYKIHNDRINTVILTSKNKFATASSDKTSKLINLKGDVKQTFSGHSHYVI